MNNENQLKEIQEKYKDCNLLIPASTELQLNPFYKYTVMEVACDISDKSGDIFKVGSMKSGRKIGGKDEYIDVFSPAKPLLMKLAAAAGIQFDPEHTYGTRVDKNTYKAKAFGAMRMPDGTGKTHADEKVICLDDEEDNYRLEFMDKSIKGITDEKPAKAAAELFKGKWIDSKDKWNNPCKAYVIDECDREKYIERSVLVNMTLLRKTVAEKAMTGAILRVIRALIGMKGTYTIEELKRPFAIPRVTFSPDYTDPTVRKAMLEQGLGSVGNMFGSTAMLTQSTCVENNVKEEIFDVDSYADNAAFASDNQQINPEDEMPPFEDGSRNINSTSEQASSVDMSVYHCDECEEVISENVYKYSIEKYERPLCMKCQRGAGK